MSNKSSLRNEALWESGASGKAFFIRSIPSLTFRIVYLLFSIYWLYRWHYLEASYLFLAMGLFFFFTAVYLLFFPLYSGKNHHYALREGRLIVSGFLGRKRQIPLGDIVEVRDISSPIDRKEGCRSFEIEYKEDEYENSFYEMLSVLNAADFEKMIKLRAIAAVGEKQSKKEKIKKHFSLDRTRLTIAVSAVVLGIILIYLGFLLFTPSLRVGFKRVQDNTIFLFAKLTRPITEDSILIGSFGKDATSCCSNLSANKEEMSTNNEEISYPYYGSNMTIYLVDRFTQQPLIKLSQEYIKEVYLCVADGAVPDRNARVFFGDRRISFWTCKWKWMESKCCMPWRGPE